MNDALSEFLKNYNEMMKKFFEDISRRNTSPMIEAIIQLQESIKPISLKISDYYNNQTFKILTDYIASATKDIAKWNNNAINIIIKNYCNSVDWSNFLSNYTEILKDINFENIDLNSDGTIQYEEEKIKIEENTVNEALNILKDIKEDTSDIKKKLLSKKSIIVVIILFIISGIFEGFFNKCGESIFELIPSAYNSFIEDNNYQDEDSSRIEFLDKFRIVNANELNVREMPSSESILIGKLYLNQCVEVIDKTKYWTKIRYTNREKEITIIGWVYGRYLLTFDEQTSALIVQE